MNQLHMKRLQIKMRVMINTLLTLLLGATYAGCAVDYGPLMPEDLIQVLGEVTNEEGEPLQSIQVVVNTSRITLNDTLYTNSAGQFGADYGFPQEGNDTLHVIVNDTTNLYASDTMHMAFSDMKIGQKTEWETVHFAEMEIQLKKK